MIEFARFDGEDAEAVDVICTRAQALFRSLNVKRSPLEIRMDISAVHAKVPLRLDAFASADDFNFNHDIGGIYRHLNRQTGELENFFVPRFAA